MLAPRRPSRARRGSRPRPGRSPRAAMTWRSHSSRAKEWEPTRVRAQSAARRRGREAHVLGLLPCVGLLAVEAHPRLRAAVVVDADELPVVHAGEVHALELG